jgi:hypothetical protein
MMDIANRQQQFFPASRLCHHLTGILCLPASECEMRALSVGNI